VTDLEALVGQGIHTIRVVYPDLHGICRGKDVPIEMFDHVAAHGLAFCSAVMTTDLRHTPVLGQEVGYPDLVAHPDRSAITPLPWVPGVAWCLADLRPVGSTEPLPLCGRSLIRAAEARFSGRGLSPVIGPELEFYLLDPDALGGYRRYVDTLSMVYTVGAISDPRGVSNTILRHLYDIGLGVFALNHEYMNSQYEINLVHGPALDAADRAFLLKAAVKDIAATRGMLATFLGKPFNDQGGSGFHFHVSLAGDEGTTNAFADPDAEDGLSVVCHRFIAGVLAHAQALMAFLAPTINAYKRLVPDSLAPTHANWGYDNRTAFVRVPQERGAATRIELRVGDGTANSYLATAAILAAGFDGIDRELELPPAVSGDAYHLQDASIGEALPRTLAAALQALTADEVVREIMGEDLVTGFTAVKGFEVERFEQWVTDWEVTEYMTHL
jgi:glutamine synthetase